MAKSLVIVESPAKAKTINKYLGSEYVVEASIGHIMDLPKNDIGVELERRTFEPTLVVSPGKEKVVERLKKLAAKADFVYLAPDPDREGEAIAAHLAMQLLPVMKDKSKLRRVTFNEITQKAVKAAFAHSRDIDENLVDAQQTRRVLDRLVGYQISPLLWEKVRRGLSAGRVQTVALRLIVEREQEINEFKPVEYWNIDAKLKASEASLKTGRARRSRRSLSAWMAWRRASRTAWTRRGRSNFFPVRCRTKRLLRRSWLSWRRPSGVCAAWRRRSGGRTRQHRISPASCSRTHRAGWASTCGGRWAWRSGCMRAWRSARRGRSD